MSVQIDQFCLPVMKGSGRLNLVTAIDRARRLPALRACASGIRPLGAGTSLLIGCGCWLHREDFARRFVITGTSVSDGTAMASIDREATVGALEAGQLPCDGGERRVVRTARAEVTDRMLIAGPPRLRAVLDEYAAHHSQHRPHRARNLRPPDRDDMTMAEISGLTTARIRRRSVVRGLINHYERAA